MKYKILDQFNISKSILAYLKDFGAIHNDMIVVLKSRKISNCYINARILNEKVDGKYVHQDFLEDIGALISSCAKDLGADMVLGVVTTGATLAKFTGKSSGIEVCYINPHDENPMPSANIAHRRVLIVEDTTTTGRSIADAVKNCELANAEVVGALTLVRRDPKNITRAEVGLSSILQTFISLCDIDFDIIVEDADENSVLLGSGLPIRLDIGYAATDGWPEKHREFEYVGTPVIKD